MKNNKSNVFTFISIFLAVGLLLSLALNKPCTGKIETMKGAHIPMKCNWTYKAILPLSLGILASGFIGLFMKNMREIRLLCIFNLFLNLISIYMITRGIGVCSVSTMPCISMKKYVLILNVILIIVGIIQYCNNTSYFNRRKRRFI